MRLRKRAIAAVTTVVLSTGLLTLVTASASVAAPVGAGFTVTPGDLAFILRQIKIAERHATTLTASNPCGTLVALPGDGIPDSEQVPDIFTPYGLRTVDGSCNNLKAAISPTPAPVPLAGNPDPSAYGAADQVFPRLTTPVFRNAEPITPAFPVGPPGPTSYQQKTGSVVDSQPRVISNLIDDQTAANPAAVAAALHPIRSQHPSTPSAVPCTTDPDPLANPPTDGVPAGCTPSNQTLFIPNIATNGGLSPPYNSLFTFFGQFFDHGLDQTVKSGGAVFVPLHADDPLVTVGPDGKPNTGDEVPPSQAFMVLTRAKNQPGPDGILGTADDVQDASNTDSPWVDQSQTYASHASHQVFLREYVHVNGTPGPNTPAAIADGNLLQGIANDDPLPCQKPAPFECYNDGAAGTGSLATWASVRKQAHDLLGLRLEDRDVLNVPMIATDPYGKYLPGPHGLPQYVTTTGLVEGHLDDPSTPTVDETVPVPANVIHFDTPFIGDIAHNADPSMQDTNGDGQPDTWPAPDADSTIQTDFTKQQPGTYDDELLATHFACGDGRCNENIALTAIHQVFHSEHDRLVADIRHVLESDTSDTGKQALHDWQAIGVQGANGTGGYAFGERLFQAARFVTEMEYQHLVFEGFVRKVQPAVRVFHGYTPDINPAIDAEFAQAVYRFGHSMLDDTVARTTVDPSTGARTDDSLPLLGAFLNPPAFFQSKGGTLTPRQAAGSVIMGSSDQTGNEIDEFVTQTLRNNLLGLPLDLAAINIARAREAGIPPLNTVRADLFAQTHDPQLAPYTSWADFGQHLKHPESLINFVAAYGTHPSIVSATTIADKRAAARAIVNPQSGDTPPADASDFLFGTGAWANQPTGLGDVDLWVGGLAEVTPLNGGMLGSTFNYVFQTQMEKLQDGDRFYYLGRTLGLNLLSQLESDTFAELFMRNTDGTSTLKGDAFSTADCKFELANLTTPAPSGSYNTGPGSVADDPTTTCDENKLLLEKPDGTITYRLVNPVDASGFNGQSVYNGTPGPDRVVGGVDDDTLWGNDGNDRLEGNGGNDTIVGGAGNDIETDSSGNDVMLGGPGNDAIDGGIGNDLLLGNDGQDFMNGGGNDNESFGGPGNDYIMAGDGADTAFGDGGDDWIEGGTGQDILHGDHGAPFLDDPGESAPGNDIFVGQSGDNTFDAEGGDDIMEQSAAIDRNIGAAGFDWASHQYDNAPANDDMMINNNQGGVPIQVLVNRDHWQEVEGDSGGPFNDVIKGTDAGIAIPRLVGGAGLAGCDALDQAGVARIKGLADILPPVSQWPGTAAQVAAISASGRCPLSGPVWGEGDILLGGPGSDTFTGRAGNDIIDGDRELRVAIAVTDGQGNELGRTDLMEHPATSGTFGPGTDGMTLQQAVFAGLVDPGNLVNVREIVDTVTAPPDCAAANPVNCDTAVYAGPRSQYTITQNPNGSVTVTDTAATTGTGATGEHTTAGAAAGDGTDTLFHIERLQFSDSVVDLTIPSGVVAMAGDTQAAVFWNPPLGLSEPITGFAIDVITGGAVAETVTAPANVGSTVVTGLTNGTQYTFVVRALMASGPGPDSVASNAVTPAPAPPSATVPGAPAISTVTAADGSAQVTWTAPASDGGAPITGYSVVASIASSGSVAATHIVAAGVTSLVVTGLSNGTAYQFTVAAINSAGTGAASNPSDTVTPAGVPGPPTVASAKPGNHAVTLSWTAPVSDNGSPLTDYAVQVLGPDHVQVGALHFAGSGSATSLVVSGLVNGTPYTFVVSALNAVGSGAPSTPSAPVTPRTRPGPPTIGTVTRGSASATVRWRAPTDDGGSPITGYFVKVSSAVTGAQVGALRPAGRSARSLIVTGLVNGGRYRFQVTAVNVAGGGVYSARSPVVVPATVPRAPTSVRATVGLVHFVPIGTVQWAPPTFNGGSAVTGYVVRAFSFSPSGAVVSMTLTGVLSASRRSLSMPLAVGRYRFTVQAINAVGRGAQSPMSNLVVVR